MAMSSWIQVSKNSGSGNAQINATAIKNTADARSTIITITAAGLTKTINCNQAAAPKYSLSISANTVNSSGVIITNIGDCGITSVTGSKTGSFFENTSCTVVAKAAPTGYTFDGWYDGGSKVASQLEFTFTLTTNRVLVAKYRINSYIITWNPNGGSVSPTTTTKEYNQTIGSLPTPTRSSTAEYTYTFAGWYTSTSGGTQVTASTKVTSNVTYYARWTSIKRSYTATFNSNGGNTPNPSTITKEYGTALGTLPTCTRTGYTFNGWFTASSGGTKISTSTIVTANVTYYAQWSINSYTLTYNANGGTVSPTSKSLNYGAAYGTLPTPTRTSTAQYSYSFKGWFTAATGGTQVSANTVMGAGNVTIYAQWNQTLRSYTVSYQTNYGSVSKSSESVNYGSTGSCSVTVPSDTAQYDYTFVGWFTQANGAGTKIGSSTTLTTPTISGTVTYYAYITRTIKSYTHTFTGGTPGSITKQYGQTLGTLPTATKASTVEYDYTFVGWFDTNASSGGTQATTSTTVTGTKTWYPRFTAVKRRYTITVNSNNTNYGTVSGGGTYDYGTSVTLIATPKSGYRLKQWEDGSTATSRKVTVTGTKTYTATFEAIPYLNLNKTELVFESTGGTQTVTVESNVSWTVS